MEKRERGSYILWVSLRMVKEKQQGIPSAGFVVEELGFLRVQLVSMAFWVLSKAMAPNFSQ